MLVQTLGFFSEQASDGCVGVPRAVRAIQVPRMQQEFVIFAEMSLQG